MTSWDPRAAKTPRATKDVYNGYGTKGEVQVLLIESIMGGT